METVIEIFTAIGILYSLWCAGYAATWIHQATRVSRKYEAKYPGLKVGSVISINLGGVS